jgi:phosphate transport system substrate-binding protein
VRDLSYSPLSRPLFLYVNAESIQRPEVQEFLKFYIGTAGEIVADVGYVASPDQVYADDQASLQAAIDGTGTPDSAQ